MNGSWIARLIDDSIGAILPVPFCPYHFVPYHFVLEPNPQRRSRLQHGYCIGVSRRSAQATAGKGPAQGPYGAARAGMEPTTLRLKVIVSTKAPPGPTIL